MTKTAMDASCVRDVVCVGLALALQLLGSSLLLSAYRVIVPGVASLAVSLALAFVSYLAVTRAPHLIPDGAWALVGALASAGGVALVGLGPSPLVVTLGDCLRAVGGLCILFFVGLALVDVAVRWGRVAALLCLALGWALELPLLAVGQSLPPAWQLAVIALVPVPIAVISLPRQRRVLSAACLSGASAEVEVTEPRSFLPVGSVVFVMFALLKVSFVFVADFVRADELSYAPLTCLASLAVAAVVLAGACFARRGERVLSGLYRLTLACVIVGFLFFVPRALGVAWTSAVGVVMLDVGGDLSRVLGYVLLFELALRNRATAPGVSMVVSIVNILGSLLGAVLSMTAVGLAQEPSSYQVLLIGFASALVVLNLAVPKALSFDEAVADVQPLSTPVAAAPADVVESASQRVAAAFSLTPRETQVLGLLAHGHGAQAVQERMGISRNTVKMHVRNVYAKLGVHSRQELIDLVESEEWR